MKAEQNQRLTQVGPGTPGGELLRRYWQPVALLDGFDPVLDPAMGVRRVKAVCVLWRNFVRFRQAQGGWGLLDRHTQAEEKTEFERREYFSRL
jgi:phthalate 4,5-dioxygenase